MVATQVARRRGTSAQCEANTPVEGEVWVDLTEDTLRVGDGTRAGGFIMPNAFHVQNNKFNFAIAGGTSNAITISLTPAPLSYSQPLSFKFRASNSNTGAVTIDVNGIGARNVYKVSGGSLIPLAGGDIIAGALYEVAYDGVQFQMLTLYSSGLVQVGQGDLKTSTGTFSSNLHAVQENTLRIGDIVIKPGGEYGFDVRAYSSTGSGVQLRPGWLTGADATGNYISYASAYFQNTTGSAQSTIVYGQQRYITSSPPYDLGDGEVGGFIFALVNSAGDIVSHYSADTPPWAYNGPTDIRATHKCPISGKKFNYIRKKTSLKDVMNGKKIEYMEREITHDVKNADMGLIPHPFGEVPDGHTVVLLDPMSDLTQRMIEYQNSGGDELSEAIHKGHIKIDNSNIKRCCPKSVKPCKFKWKGSSNG